MVLSRGRLLATSGAPLLNFLVQLVIEGSLFVVKPQLACEIQGVLGLGDLRGRGIRLGDGLFPFVQ